MMNPPIPEPVFALSRPANHTSTAVFSSPHSGSDYPTEMLARSHLSLNALRSSEDAFIDELFGCAPDNGAPLIAARYPRAWIDLNRGDTELDPALIAGAPRSVRSPRINAGLGVIPRVVSDARTIQSGKITLAAARDRIAKFHRPYHDKLDALMTETRTAMGCAVLFDCHSMPHEALSGSTLVNGARPEVVLGDRFGGSCARWVMDGAVAAFTDAGFRVARNAPFAGGYITQTYGVPARGVHALQIEIDRSLYMDESAVVKNAGFDDLKTVLRDVVARLAILGGQQMPVAAE